MERFLSFAGIGAIATAIHYVVLIVGVQFLDLAPVAASSIGFGFSAFVNYSLNRRITFHSKKAHPDALPKFLAVALVGLALNAVLLAAATEILGLNYLLAQALVTALVLIWNYSINAAWTFAEGR